MTQGQNKHVRITIHFTGSRPAQAKVGCAYDCDWRERDADAALKRTWGLDCAPDPRGNSVDGCANRRGDRYLDREGRVGARASQATWQTVQQGARTTGADLHNGA